MVKYWISFVITFSLHQCVFASAGDRSKFYRDCVADCGKTRCVNNREELFSLWSCVGNCEYTCQWETVTLFIERNWPVPQFGGKWPFIRYFGLQEPASAVFSVFNFLVVLNGWRKYRKNVPQSAPYRNLWQVQSLVCLNCWFWSAIYHTRDTSATERLDYLSASCMVFTSFYSMSVRVFELTKLSLKAIVWSVICASILLNHCVYLWLFRFDYSYNMLFNVIIGAMTVVGYMVWAAINVKKGRMYCKLVGFYSALMAASALLELVDFPPIFWMFDAHALWHFSTCFIIPLFYTFITRDSLYLHEKPLGGEKVS